MLNEEQFNDIKKGLIQERDSLLQRLNEDHYDLNRAHIQESVGELSNYDNHPADGGTELYEREKDISLEEHAETYLQQINDTLARMEKGEFGVCEVCGADISPERLETIPTTTRCIEHAEHRNSHDRPVEEEALTPPFGKYDYDESEKGQTFYDAEDTWQEVSQYGTSETPQEMVESEKSYNEMYVESDERIGYVEDVENILTSDIHGNYSGVSVGHEKYEDYLDENNVPSLIEPDED
ncbi:TraR/DksA C4-type zinc finger protein [Evansella halocellulosilytica]|uniref:TraR/DksA C4-type zinc finger protein n=1 Tax=Evansella halocellulosilytica TaxID=2011013 RepID=UPI000BB7CDC1|nr:TraR/DksA C4-type zinc finger protein [Evansella halocellulosilytica]